MKKNIFVILLTFAASLFSNAIPAFDETLHDSWAQRFEMDELLFEEKSEHQDISVFRNKLFGRILAIDGIIQACEKDEFVYH